MFKRITAVVMVLMLVVAGFSLRESFAGPKTEFIDGNPATGVKGTKVTSEYLNKVSYGVPTGEDQQGSFPTLYSLDTGTTNSFSVTLYQGKTRVVSTNTGTATNKLIDSLATFQTASVITGDVVLNLTDRTSTTVTAIDSQTQLSLSSNIFTATSKSYAVGRDIQQLPQAYKEGITVSFTATNANTGASTIDVNGLGPVAIKKNGSLALEAGDIQVGQIVAVNYDGTNMQWLNPPSDRLYRINNNGALVLQKTDANGNYTIGPTGSGANKILSQLNGVSIGARFVVLDAYIYLDHYTDATAACNSIAIFRATGTSYSSGSIMASAKVSQEITHAAATLIVPLDGNKMFTINWGNDTTPGSIHALYITVIGYIK